MNFNQFIKTCYEKEIIKSLTIFIISFWTVIQVSHVTHEAVGLPEEFVSILVILFFLSLPFYIFYIWNKKGKETSFENLNEQNQNQSRGFKLWYFRSFLATTILCVAMVVFVVSNKFSSKANTNNLAIEKQENLDKVAVISFKNNTGNEANDIIGEMSSDWISHGIISENVARVITPDVVNGYEKLFEANQLKLPQIEIINAYLKPGQLITGSFFEDNGELVFNSTITDGATNEVTYTFQNERCDINSPLDCINNLKEKILSILVDDERKDHLLEDSPPKFQAYRLMLQAKNLNDLASNEYISLLEKALEIDPDYFEAKVNRIGYYYNMGEYTVADILVNEIDIESTQNMRQVNILNIYKALLSGKNDEVYHSMLNEFILSPFDIQNNNAMLIISKQFVNKPELVLKYKNYVEENIINQFDCPTCVDRADIIMNSHLSLNQLDSVKMLYAKYDKLQTKFPLIYTNTVAHLRTNQNDKVLELVTQARRELTKEEFSEFISMLNNESLLRYGKELSFLQQYYDDLYNSHKIIIDFQRGNFQSTIDTYKKEQPVNAAENSRYAMALYKSGNKEKAREIIAELEEQFNQYDFGKTDYAIAQYYAAINQETKAYQYLEKAIKRGYYFTDRTFQNDYIFSKINQEPKFKQLMNFWNNKL